MKKIFLPILLVCSLSCKKSVDINSVANVSGVQSANAVAAIPAVAIGTQVWMQKNLAVKTYRNGDPIQYIPYVKGNTLWTATTAGAWCYYNNDPGTEAVYGLLYNAYAALDPRGLAPKGWHVPSSDEWNTLSDYLGGVQHAGGEMKAVNNLWQSPNTGATNSSGFTGLPGGNRAGYSGAGTFSNINKRGYWWTTALSGSNSCYSKWVSYNLTSLVSAISSKNSGASVRCIKN
jgi:uncharacterized protein (TIGR02145 family)